MHAAGQPAVLSRHRGNHQSLALSLGQRPLVVLNSPEPLAIYMAMTANGWPMVRIPTFPIPPMHTRSSTPSWVIHLPRSELSGSHSRLPRQSGRERGDPQLHVRDGNAYTIAPGYSQEFREDRAWAIQFSRARTWNKPSTGSGWACTRLPVRTTVGNCTAASCPERWTCKGHDLDQACFEAAGADRIRATLRSLIFSVTMKLRSLTWLYRQKNTQSRTREMSPRCGQSPARQRPERFGAFSGIWADRPAIVALWCVGIGFVLGWKLKLW